MRDYSAGVVDTLAWVHILLKNNEKQNNECEDCSVKKKIVRALVELEAVVAADFAERVRIIS